MRCSEAATLRSHKLAPWQEWRARGRRRGRGGNPREAAAAARFAPTLPPCQPVEASRRERPGMECGGVGVGGGDVKKA